MSGRGKRVKFRLKVVGLAFTAVFAVMLYHAYLLQVERQGELLKKSNNETFRNIDLGNVRGEIFDAHGERLAASLSVFSLTADPSLMKPRQIKDEDGRVIETVDTKTEAAEKLHEVLGLDKEYLIKKFNEPGRQFLWLKRQLKAEEAEAVATLKIPGVQLKNEYKRDYPNAHLAAHFLGFVGLDGEGLEGLELALDDYLKPKNGKVRVKRDNTGRYVVDSVDGELKPSKGASVVLTIDRRIQYVTEKALAKAVDRHRAKSGMALVMDPKTGAIIASAVWPTYDPNNYQDAQKFELRNRILTDPFEPGSTFKVFVVAAALEEGLVTPETIVNCENGAMRVGNHTVRDTSSHGDLTISEVIKKSSNIGSLKIGGILGNDLLYNYLKRFSFGERTGLAHLSGEAAGSLRHHSQWRQVEAANIAFGQGLTVTTLQMVMAMSSLANQGVLMKPYIVDRVLDEDGRTIEKNEPQILRQVVSPLTARQVAAMLRMAAQPGGTATRAEVVGYPVAGKTGTAQKVVAGSKGYAAGRYVSSFLGFAPYHDPKLCVMVVLDEPRNGYYGGSVAAPAFKEIMEQALPLMDVPPTEGQGDPVWPILQKNGGGAPGVIEANLPTNFIRVKFKKNDRGSRGPITIAAMSPEKALSYGELEPVFSDVSMGLISDPGTMPDLSGLSMRQVMEVMSEYSLDIEYFGSGHVVGQSPQAGASILAGQPVTVIFER